MKREFLALGNNLLLMEKSLFRLHPIFPSSSISFLLLAIISFENWNMSADALRINKDVSPMGISWRWFRLRLRTLRAARSPI